MKQLDFLLVTVFLGTEGVGLKVRRLVRKFYGQSNSQLRDGECPNQGTVSGKKRTQKISFRK